MITSARSFTGRISLFILVLLYFIAGSTLAQGTSNKGTDFWVAYTGHVDGLDSRLTLFISAQSTARVTINAGGTALSPITVPANQAVPVTLNPNIYRNIYVGLMDGIAVKSGIHVTSDVPIVVYSLISHNARSGASLIFPTKALGNEYYTIAFDQIASTFGNNAETRLSEFTVVGVEDNTQVQITPSQNSVGNQAHRAHLPFTITLNKGDVYQFQSITDLTGSRVETVGDCKPLAVFSGSTKAHFCETGAGGGSGDNLYQQLLPLSAWGKNFVTAPFYNAINGSTDIYRIIVGEDNANITVNGSATSANGVRLSNPYIKGSVITFTSQSSNVISADKPISVTQFQPNQTCNTRNQDNSASVPFPGDPEMTILSPIEQTLTDVTLYSAVSVTGIAPTNIDRHFINVILETADITNFRLDGQPVPATSFRPINGTYSFLIQNVTQSSANNPTHRLTSSKGFMAIAYGYGAVESYAYLGGSDLRNLNQYLEAKTFSTNTIAASGCIGVPYNFTLRLPYQLRSTDPIQWDLGNGTTYTQNNPTPSSIDQSGSSPVYIYEYNRPGGATYTSTGNYAVEATVVNPSPSGCDGIETVDYSFDVYALPTASFTAPPEACATLPVTFTDKSTDPVNSVSKWLWDFGDGSPVSTAQNPSHAFAARGTYTVSLTATGSTGCASNTYTSTIVINALPVPRFTYSTPDCETKNILFTDASTSQDGAITSWTWDFGDGSAAVVNNSNAPVTHTFVAAGTYAVSLKVVTAKSCEAVYTVSNVIIYPQPVANFTLPGICLADGAATFSNTSSISDNSTLSYLWNFGDASSNPGGSGFNTSTQRNPSHTYSNAGDYTVSLTVTSANGCSTTLTQLFTVNGSNPVAAFTVQSPSSLCSNQPVTFQDRSGVSPGSLVRLELDYGDGLVQVVIRPQPGAIYTHSYAPFSSPATKTVNVTVKAFSGTVCYDISTQTITLKAVPSVVFNTLAPVCLEVPAFLITEAKETSNFAGTGSFSGPGISPEGLFDPSKAGVGTHTLTYRFTGANGCEEQKSQAIIVYPTPSVNAGKDLFILQGGETLINASASGNNLSYKWYPSTGLSRDDILHPVASPSEDITYTLTVTSDQGCFAADEVFVKVLKTPVVPNAFTPNGDGINDTWNIQYLSSYPGATVQIYERYGGKLLTTLGYGQPWDGTSKGQPVPAGVYYYLIDPKNGRKVMYGSVTVIR